VLTDRAVIFSGEAKRPDMPKGITPLQHGEVADAVTKATSHGVRWCFTTNFHQIAIFDAGAETSSPLSILQGRVIDWIPRSLADHDGWWQNLTAEKKREAAAQGLQDLFQRVRLRRAGHVAVARADDVVVDFFSELTTRLLDPLTRVFQSSNASADAELRNRALVAGLDPDDRQDAKYLVAQGMFEVLTAVLFHRVLQSHFGQLETVLSGTSPTKGTRLFATVKKALKEAEHVSGDYQSILTLSSIGDWVLREAEADATRHWIATVQFIDSLEVGALTGDVLGTIFERLISPDRRHELGQHYTQPRLARSMAAWGVRDASDTVLDPSCGSGTFLVETYACHERLGLTHDEILEQTFANDLDGFAVHLAAINLATRKVRKGINHPLVRYGDAFELAEGVAVVEVAGHAKALPKVDLIIANPPYGRSHPDEAAALAAVSKLLGASTKLPGVTGINLAAWFVLLGAGLVKPTGRMAYVLPSSVLQNESLGEWRAWIRRRWNLVIWHTEDDIWFSDARVAPCVVLFTPRTKRLSGLGSVSFVNVKDVASGQLISLDGVPSPSEQATTRDLSTVDAQGDLLSQGTMPEALLEFARASQVCCIGQLRNCTAAAGQKLGHAFFTLRDAHPERDAVLRDVEGLKTTFKLNRKYLTPLLTSPKQLDAGGAFTADTFLLTLPPAEPSSAAVHAYINHGRSLDVHKSPSVAARGAYWWSITPRLFNIAVAMSAQFRHQIAWLTPAGVIKNNFNGLQFDDDSSPDDAEVVAASLASAFGALATLYVSGEVGCEGARRILLSQFVEWPVLNPATVAKAARKQLRAAYADFRQYPASEMDEIPTEALASWHALTRAVAQAGLGSTGTPAMAATLASAAINEVQSTVARRRRREAAALQGRTRSTSGSNTSALSVRFKQWASMKPHASVVETLCSGASVSKLRDLTEIEHLSLFGSSGGLDEAPHVERQLVLRLGVGFEAAWPDAHTHRPLLERLPKDVDQLRGALHATLLGKPPDAATSARQTWDALSREVTTMLLRLLQSEVRKVMG
jgi:N-6 DNA Methylase